MAVAVQYDEHHLPAGAPAGVCGSCQSDWMGGGQGTLPLEPETSGDGLDIYNCTLLYSTVVEMYSIALNCVGTVLNCT